nr:TolC family protein [uncultured Dysosmobacter sp.]
MRKKWIALALAAALILSLGAVSALAESETQTPETQDPVTEEETTPQGEDGELSQEETPEEDAGDEGEETQPVSPAGPDQALPDTDYVPDAMGSVTFANVERRMREGNLNILALQESVDMLESIDYADLQEDLRKQLNEIAKGQWYMVLMGQSGTEAYKQMDKAYAAVREQFDAIKDGEMQSDNADSIRQLHHLQDQIILSGEATYVAVAAMEIQAASLQRQLEAANRTVEEMSLRYQLGQISALQLSQAKAGQSSLASGLETLRMNLKTYKAQLQMLLGAEMNGRLQLGAIPAVTAQQLADMDVERDLETSKSRSYDLYTAGQTLEDERETYKEAGDRYAYDEKEMSFRQAKHTWQAAQFNYNNTVQDYERRFRSLYDQVQDYHQVWQASQVSLESQKLSFAASELKYQQGTISHNALLTAQDDLSNAEEAVKQAANDLFSAYNTYCWAVQNGILN